VVRRKPPNLKAWETVGEPRLLVIGHYRMYTNVDARGDGAHVMIVIDYALPARRPHIGWACFSDGCTRAGA
jgi:hypothetical protein